MKKEQPRAGVPRKDDETAVDNRAAQRHQDQSQAEPAAANVEESPFMDRGDSALGSGESMSHGRESTEESQRAAESLRGGELDTQYGTKSSMKTGQPSGQPSGTSAETAKGGDRKPSGNPDHGERASRAGSEAGRPAARGTTGGGDRAPAAPNPGSSEESSGAERDTMTGPRPGSGS